MQFALESQPDLDSDEESVMHQSCVLCFIYVICKCVMAVHDTALEVAKLTIISAT